MRLFILLASFSLLGVGCQGQNGPWTGFMWSESQLDPVSHKPLIGGSFATPEYQSSVGQFLSREECKAWAETIEKIKPNSLYMCAEGCGQVEEGLNCKLSTSETFTIENPNK